MNAEERSYLDAEVIQMLAELDRVTRDTTFNEIAVLDGHLLIDVFKLEHMKENLPLINIFNEIRCIRCI